MGAKNRVIAGDYYFCCVDVNFKGLYIKQGFFSGINLNKDTVETYEVITDEHRKSAKSGIMRGAVGGALLGPIGLLGGALSAKSKGIYTVAIKLKDGKNSLIEIDEQKYKMLVRSCF